LNSAFIGVLKSDFQTSQSLQSYEILVIMKRLKRKVVKEVLIAYCMLGEPPSRSLMLGPTSPMQSRDARTKLLLLVKEKY
jgi:hypothetical protein